MKIKSTAKCSKGGILQYFRLSLSYHLSLRSLFCLFLSGRLRHVLLYKGDLLAQNSRQSHFVGIHLKISTKIGILIYLTSADFMFMLTEHKNGCLISGPGFYGHRPFSQRVFGDSNPFITLQISPLSHVFPVFIVLEVVFQTSHISFYRNCTSKSWMIFIFLHTFLPYHSRTPGSQRHRKFWFGSL